MSENIIQRAELLIQQKRYNDAEKLLKELLGQDPHDVHVLMLLSEVYLQKDQYDNAEKFINLAIGIQPDYHLLFYIKARICLQKEKYDEAEKYLNQALAIEPSDADYYSLLGNIKLNRKENEKALEFANKSLELDPENILALNTRSTALLKLNKHGESFQTIEGALREDPNNAFTHSNYGWLLLEKGDHKKALEHFREALKNDPTLETAQSGMVEALKASNFAYRWFLKYSFWMGNLTSKYQWAVILGLYISIQVLRGIARSNKSLEPFIYPIIILLTIFAFSTWLFAPISNLFLRFNKYGKHLLNKDQIMSSNLVGICFVIFLIGGGFYLFTLHPTFVVVGIFGFTMMIPLSKVFSSVRYKHVFIIYASLMGLIGICAIAYTIEKGSVSSIFSIIYLLGFIAFQWMSNILLIKESNK